jgi:hypothetical protein
MKQILYKKNLKGKMIQWTGYSYKGETFIEYGQVGGNLRIKQANKRLAKLVNDKLNDGYRGDPNDPTMGLDINNRIKPALANKDLTKAELPCYIQPKYNGVKSLMSMSTVFEGKGIFTTKIKKILFTSKTGHSYNMPYLENLIKTIFPPEIFEIDGEQTIFDGELYIHDKKLNYIKASIPMVNEHGTISRPKNNPLAVSYVIYDIANSKLNQTERLDILKKLFITISGNNVGVSIMAIDSGVPLCLSQTGLVTSLERAREIAAEYVTKGFEGAILRKLKNYYQGGERTNDLIKIKFQETGRFRILDILPKPTEPTGIFVLQNDTNNEIFKSNPTGTYETRKKYLRLRDKYIGKIAEIKYEERGGANDVPMHSNVIKIL